MNLQNVNISPLQLNYACYHTNVPVLVLGLSSSEHSLKSLLSASVFISKHSNSMKLPPHTQHGNIDGQ